MQRLRWTPGHWGRQLPPPSGGGRRRDASPSLHSVNDGVHERRGPHHGLEEEEVDFEHRGEEGPEPEARRYPTGEEGRHERDISLASSLTA